MKFTIELPDNTVEWLESLKGVGSPEEHIARVVTVNLSSLIQQQPPPKYAAVIQQFKDLCTPVVTRQA